MTTAKKKPAKAAAKKTTAPKETSAKKRSTKPQAATQLAEAATEKVTVTIAPEAPAAVEAPVAAQAAAPAAQVEEAPQAEQKPVLTIGMFQKRLYERGFYGGHWDGHYGPLTKEAVARFQHHNGLHPDGEPTPETLAKLGF